MQSLWRAKSKAMAFSGIPGQSLANELQIYKFTCLHCLVRFWASVCAKDTVQGQICGNLCFLGFALSWCRGGSAAPMATFSHASCHLGPGQSDVGHSLGHRHPSVGHRCLFFSKLLPLGDQALSAAIMFCQPLWSVRSISPKKISLDALASLDLKLSVTESVIYRFQLAQLRVFQIIFFRSKIFVTPSCFHFFGVKRPLGNQRNADSEKYFSFWGVFIMALSRLDFGAKNFTH